MKLRKARPDKDGGVRAFGEGLCGVDVSAANVERAVAALQGLAAGVEAKGLTPKPTGKCLRVELGQEVVEVMLNERTRWVAHVPTEQELLAEERRQKRLARGYSSPWPTGGYGIWGRVYADKDLIYTGQLSVQLEGWGEGVRRNWADGKKQTVESLLEEIPVGIALGDPVFNLKARDDLIGWSAAERSRRLVNIMDAYVLGAIPPYSFLLGGKLISCLIRTREVRDDFALKYANTRGIISREKKRAQLVMITTSSSLGRSSVYNRLKIDDRNYLTPIGFTSGWGHFHVPDSLFASLRDYLRDADHRYVDGHYFGQGPNWRLRTIRAAFDALGFDADLLKHGIKREVFRFGNYAGCQVFASWI